MEATIIFTPDPAKPAPLYAHYQGQMQPQPAYVSLDLRTGGIDADYSGDIGNSVPESVFRGLVRRYPIRSDLTAAQVMEVLEDIKPLLQRVLDGSEIVWQDCDQVARLNADAEAAEDEIVGTDGPLGADMDSMVITDLADWLADVGPDGWLPGDDDDADEFIRNFDLDGYLCADDVADTLATLWADHLYDGNPLPKSVAQYLIRDGRCADSAWVEELAAYAEGREPEAAH